ncbi:MULTISPECIES: hypothetical protein [unclassified Streptomyces]|uniref:hypothetical protein n=1 Tax=unclassified Streptomyces TaxID=2593676 RepID=UPI00324C8DA4
MNAKKQYPGPKLLPDEGAAVDEHGRPPRAPSRTGPGTGPDASRVERAAEEGDVRETGASLSANLDEGKRAPAE